MAVTILDAPVLNAGGNLPLTPSAGAGNGQRILLIAEMRESNGTSVLTEQIVGSTTTNILGQINTGTMDVYLTYVLDADFGTLAVNDDITHNGSASGAIQAIVLDGVDQTTPFTNTDQVGYDFHSTQTGGAIPFTLDEVLDGMGVVFAGHSKTTGTWGYGSYTEQLLSDNGGNQHYAVATKSFTADATAVENSLTNTLPADKFGIGAVVLRPAEVVVPDPKDVSAVSTLKAMTQQAAVTVIDQVPPFVSAVSTLKAMTQQAVASLVSNTIGNGSASETLIGANDLPLANETFDFFIADSFGGALTDTGTLTTDANGTFTLSALFSTAGDRWIGIKDRANETETALFPITVT